MKVQKILVPIDFSKTSHHALACAHSFAETFRAGLFILHVEDLPELNPLNPSVETLVPSYSALEEVIKVRHEGSRAKMGQWLEEMRREGVDTSMVFQSGSPCERIIDVAEELECDMIIMGTHGRTGFQRLLLGSTAERVVRTSPIPVMTVREQTAAET